MQKEIPILFSTPMVQGIKEGRKTMTRRIKGLEFINESFSQWEYLGVNEYGHLMRNEHGATNAIKCPYGIPGDLLWVKENYIIYNNDGGKQIYISAETEVGTFRTFNYKDIPYETLAKVSEYPVHKWISKPSIFLFKHFARIWLEVTEVRVERLQDISEDDIVSEGVRIPVNGKGTNRVLLEMGGKNKAIDFLPEGCLLPGAPKLTQQQLLFAHWAELWHKINGEASWKANPWVWVVSFKVLSTTGKPLEEITTEAYPH